MQQILKTVGVSVPLKYTIYQMVTKFWATDSLLKKKHSKQDVFFQMKLFCNCLCEVMCSGKIDLLLTYVTDEQFYINSYVNTWNKK